jgi:predicted amidohydrolase YtcJ
MAMHYGCHHALANSRALALAGIDRHTPDPSGGRIARGARGEPSGLLVERALCRVERLARASLLASDAPGFLARIRAHHDALLEHGITRVVDATVPLDVIALYREASRSGALRVPTVAMPVSVGGYLEAPWDALDGPVTGEDDGVLSIGPLKLVLDGAPECSMCLSVWQTVGTLAGACALAVASGSLDPVRTVMSARPRLGAGGKLRTGISMYAREDASAIVRAATERGFAIATHAVGNDATDTAMAAYAAAGPALGRGGRPRIEHALFVDRALAQRIGDLGVGVVTQPAFLGLPTFATGPSIVGLGTIPLRMLLDAGVTVAGSSDYPVATFDPLAGVRAAVTRRTPGGREHEPEQRVSLHEALTMYTRSAAELSGCLDCAGTLAPGKRADLVVLDRALDAASLGAARVRATVIGGDLAFGSPTAP